MDTDHAPLASPAGRERPKAIRVDRPVPSPQARFQNPWVPFPEGIAVLKELRSLLERPDEGRPRNLALLAAPSFGKSHLLDHFADCYPDITEPGSPRIQVLSIELPPSADASRLLRELLTALAVDFSLRHPPDELLRKVVIHIKSLAVGLVVIDEFHNAIGGRRDRAVDVVQTIRALSNRAQRPIVVAGTKNVGEVLRHDEQLNQRFVRWTLPLWDEPGYVKRMLAGFDLAYGFPGIATDDVAKKMITLTEGRPGTISQVLLDAHRMSQSPKHKDTTAESLIETCALALQGATVGA